MTSLVLELQHDAIGSDIPIGTLLRKALVVARKLAIKEFQAWVESELKGYLRQSIVPDYREVFGTAQAFNPYRGWTPILFQNSNLADKVQTRRITDSATELEKMVNGSRKDKFAYMSFPPEVEILLMEHINRRMRIALCTSYDQFHGIIEAVRNTILAWSLKLEEDGILGDGMTFSQEEKQVASTVNYQVNNFIGSSGGNQVQQGTQSSQQTMNILPENLQKLSEFIDLLTSQLTELNLSNDQLSQVQSDIDMLKTQFNSPKPKTTVIQEGVRSIRNVLEGLTGSLIASGLLYQLGSLI